VELCTFI